MNNKLILLNKTILESLNENDDIKIVKKFTTVGMKILDADFGFVWLNSYASQKWNLVYKSPNTPYNPLKPRAHGRNIHVLQSSKPDFVQKIKKRADKYDVSAYMESFVIIPLVYKKATYGSMVLCFKKHQSFPKDKRILCSFIGNSVAQTITISRFIAGEHHAIAKERIAKTTAKLLKEEKLKIAFIANTAHELRTPLAIMKGNVDLALINNHKEQKSSKNFLRAIDSEISHLSNIISDLTLITSDIEKLKDSVNFEKINLKLLIENIIKRCAVLAREKQISLTMRSFKSSTILGNKIYLEKLFLNLIANSIIYGSSKGHTIITSSQSKGFVNINIIDDGIGIAKEDLPHIFERFYRVDKSHSSGRKNSGLGLAIVKWSTEMHNGTIRVKSVLGVGSIFTVYLPYKY